MDARTRYSITLLATSCTLAFLVTLLAKAEQQGKVIFSAAGNDSEGSDPPISAKYASPFNWAAMTARAQGHSRSGVIVAAHDRTGARASFSNSGADLSCPGVDVTSTLAFDERKQPSSQSYGTMSGTSMASPYCAAGHLLFSLVRRGYTGADSVRCMIESGVRSSDGTPMLRLDRALEKCKPVALPANELQMPRSALARVVAD